MRDKATNKPMVWDLVDKCPKVHNDPSVTRVQYEDQAHDVALLGTYDVDGTKCRPAFELLKEHVKKYSPEYVEKITWIPAATMRRLGKEIVEMRGDWRHGYHPDGARSEKNTQTAYRGALLPRLPGPCKLRMDLPVHRHDQPYARRGRYLRRRDGSGRGGRPTGTSQPASRTRFRTRTRTACLSPRPGFTTTCRTRCACPNRRPGLTCTTCSPPRSTTLSPS